MPIDHNRPLPKRPRLKDRESYKGAKGYFITIGTYNRRRLFVNDAVVASAVQYLRDIAQKEQFDVAVYCFMPDHLHIVIIGRNEHSSCEKFVRDYKQITGFRFKKVFSQRLWGTSYYDRVLRIEDEVRDVGQYTLYNPVYAGLVENVLDYPYIGSFLYRLEDLIDV